MTERQLRRSAPAEPLSGREFGVIPQRPEGRTGRLFGRVEQRAEEWHGVRTSLRTERVGGPEQMRRNARLSRQRGVTCKRIQQVKLPDPVIILMSRLHCLG